MCILLCVCIIAAIEHINYTDLCLYICTYVCLSVRICRAGEMGEGSTTMKPLHYKNSPIHRIVRGFIVQGGDFSEG